MFSEESEWMLETDHKGHILIDADPRYFAPILNYLRMNEVIVNPGVCHKGVLATAKYFQVQEVVDFFQRDQKQALFSWGSGGSGELGTQDKNDVLTPTRVDIVPGTEKVVEIALGANYSCVLTDQGKVYGFGNGDWGQLGVGNPKNFHEKAEDKTPIVTVPTVLPSLLPYKVTEIATGYAYAMAITEDYRVFFWGNNNHGQSGLGNERFGQAYRKIEEPTIVDCLLDRKIIQVGCGSFFVIALSEDTTVYSWGLIDCLGLGTVEEVRAQYPTETAESVSKDKRAVLLVPHVIEALTGKDIVHITAGQWHSCAISRRGELYTWGVGFQGRLGHGDKEPCFVPQRVGGALTGKQAISVACGSFHTVALTADGEVYCWGDNANGQCGNATLPDSVVLPHLVNALSLVGGGLARSISCGRQHTAVVMTGCLHRRDPLRRRRSDWIQKQECRCNGKDKTDYGQVYVFGESKGMGLGSPNKVFSPKLVKGMEDFNVLEVISGLHHTMIIAETLPTEGEQDHRCAFGCRPAGC
eukprot:TRINITY_DN12834_c0_g1_i1.p1 TRINITY_DN12834_c0_g1~~TRINITY_DN12834_c0_g1_i1.p1  ORF type:complete len:578 (+),score=69.28 TRINITY_DN12834_c0_g1_i1:158-1735(+)